VAKNEKLLSRWKKFLTTTSNFSESQDVRFLYGRNPIQEALSADPERLVAVAYFQGIDKPGKLLRDQLRKSGVYTIPCKSKEQIHRLCTSGDHQGFAAVAQALPEANLQILEQDKARLLLLSQIQDPGNLGAIVRNADHFGVDLVALGSKGSCSFQLASVAKSSSGAVEHQPFLEVQEMGHFLHQLKQNDFHIIGLDGEADTDLMTIETQKFPKLAMVLGSEGFGIHHKLEKHIDSMASIPRLGKVNSLNVSAASVLASWLLSQ